MHAWNIYLFISTYRYDLATQSHAKLRVQKNRIVRNAGGELFDKMYGPQQEGNFLDFASDENGIWAVFGLKGSSNQLLCF